MTPTQSGASGIVRCPSCGGRPRDTRCDCGRLEWTGPTRADVRGEAAWWCQVTLERVRELTAVLREGGMDAVAAELGDDPTLARYIADESRGSSLATLLSATEVGTLVDLGAGWGAPAAALVNVCDSYVAVDSNGLTLDFIAERLREAPADCTFVSSPEFGAEDLPLADQVADAVVCNGVLEWVGASDSKVALGRQRHFLADVARVLRPGGALLLGIENRWGLQYWMGTPDHPGTVGTTLMPRRVADRVMRRRRGKGYFELTHSLRKLEGLIRGAGFAGELHSFWAQPSYRECKLVVPIGGGSERRRAAELLAAEPTLGADPRETLMEVFKAGLRASPALGAVAPNFVLIAYR